MSDLVVVIPARGGSKRIKGKNIRPLAGKPLVHHAIEYAWALKPMEVVVSTDSEEVAGVVRTRYSNVKIDFTFPHLDTTTVDDVTKWYHDKLPYNRDATLVVIQPTMIGDVVDNAKETLDYAEHNESAGWLRCSGLRVIKGPFTHWENLRTLPNSTLIDIDTMGDFAQAETLLRGKTTIGIYYRAGEKMGRGHELRAKTLADALQDYDVWSEQLIPGNTLNFRPADVVISDVGDSIEDYMAYMVEHHRVIAIEDNGPGARLAHASINPFNDLKYAVLRPEFYNLPEYVVRENVDRIMLSFGGQDNHGWTNLVNRALVDWLSLVHDAHKNMALGMHQADLLICAGGQTSVEAIKVGVPTIVIPALPTEAMRPHLSPEYGIINLGLAPSLDRILEAVLTVKWDKMLREDMSNRMKAVTVGDGAVHIRRIVEDLCQR